MEIQHRDLLGLFVGQGVTIWEIEPSSDFITELQLLWNSKFYFHFLTDAHNHKSLHKRE